MAIPTLTPDSQVSAIVLPRSGSASDVSLQTPIGVYDAHTDFLSGAADQINYTYQKLGGDICATLGPDEPSPNAADKPFSKNLFATIPIIAFNIFYSPLATKYACSEFT